MGRKLNIGFNQGPTTLYSATGKYGLLAPSASLTKVASPSTVQRFQSGVYVALAYADCGLGPNGDTLSVDSGSFSYSAGTVSSPQTLTGNYSDGTIPGNKSGTGTSSGCNTGTGTGGHTLARNTTGPCVNVSSTQKTAAVVVRYPWNDIEGPTAGAYHFTRMDADLAQCIQLGVLWFPMIVQRTFTAAETSSNPVGYPGAPAGFAVPQYLSAYVSAGKGGTLYQSQRWELAHVNPAMCNVITAVCQRYDQCTGFGGVATQETATGNDSSGGYRTSTYYTALLNEAQAHYAAAPHSRQLAYQNFASNSSASFPSDPTGAVMLDQYSAAIQTYGAILAAPDLVIGGGSVYNSVYTSGSGVQRGRFDGYANGGTIGSGVVFSSTGPTALSIQRAEWIGVSPATGPQSIAAAMLYLIGGNPTGSQQPNFLDGVVLIEDWHQGAGSPNNQQFTPDGVNAIVNNPIPINPTGWTP